MTLLLASCSEGAQDFLAPDPDGPPKTFVNLTISPRGPQVVVGDSVHFDATGWLSTGQTTPIPVIWSASAGSISATGWFRPSGAGDFQVRAVASAQSSLTDSVNVAAVNPVGGIARLDVLPAMIAVPRGATQQFVAQGTLQDGSIVLPTVTWSATGGTITPSGLFTASGAVGTASVSATLGAGLASAQSAVAIQPAVLTQLVLDPSSVIMETGETRQVTVGASWSDGSSSLPPLIWSVQGGSLSSQQVYTAGILPGTYSLIVSSPIFLKADTSVISILPRVVGVRVSPATATLTPGAVLPLQAFAVRNDGSESPAGVQWTALGGSIAADGKYTAGTGNGSFPVVATLQALSGEVYSDTAWMSLTDGAATLTQISISPKALSVQTAATLQFVASGVWSDGTTAIPAVTWSATGGSIDAFGVYRAPTSTGIFRVIGKHKNGTRADTAVVNVDPKVETFRISPKVDTLVAGQTRQFSATLNWSDGQTHPVTISWNSTGGVISPTGVYSPGALAGGFLVVAVCSCGAADTAAVTVQNSNPPASPTLMSLSLSPQAVALALGGLQQFSATGTWSNGSTGPVGVIYDVTGGSISASGFYVAGNEAGTYRIIATQQGGVRADTSIVTINPGAPTLNQVVLNPAVIALAPGATQQFAVSGLWSDGSTAAPEVVYTVSGGTILANGLFTAGTTPGTYQIVATHLSSSQADTSVVTIAAPAGATLTQLVMNPSSVAVLPGAAQQFTVAASWSDGSSTLPPLTFTATGGTVSIAGLFTAGTVAGTYKVIVKHQGGTKADTSTVTIPQLSQLVLTPATSTVAAGGAQLFSVAGTWSNGATTPPAVSYSATGGTISPVGLYTAGSAAGTFRVVALHTGGTLADSAVVTISGAAPPPPPPPVGGTVPALPALLNTPYVAPTGQTINVAAGANLQTAINSAACGDQILLSAGATYAGNFVLPTRQCGSNPIHLRTAGSLPTEGVRVSPAIAAGFAKLVSPNTDAALKAAVRSRGWRVVAVELTVTSNLALSYGIVRVGEATENTLSDLPGNIVIDRVYIHGNAAGNIQRCVALNGDSTAVVDSYLSECHAKGFDSQAIAGWAGPGPYKIVNNYLEGAGENILFGGADPRIAGVTPSDLEIRRNHFFKPLSWIPGNTWTVKNLFELKNAKRVLFEGNVLENNWANAQVGYGILFQAISDNPAITWTTVQDVTVRYNRMTASGSGVNLLGTAHNYETPMARISFTDNVFEDIGQSGLLGEGKLLQLLGGSTGIRGLTFSHNTFLHSQASGAAHGAAIILDGNPASPHTNFVMLNNLFSVGGVGLYGNAVGVGTAALNRYALPWDFRGNALAGESAGSMYPAGNFFPSSVAALNLDASGHMASPLMGTDGYDVGANISALLSAVAGVSP